MADRVEICSYLMGSNKTNSIIKWMDNNKDEKFIYVIPNLTELEDSDYGQSRVLSIGFKTPDTMSGFRTKSEHLYHLCYTGESIACTHTLYKMLDKRTLKLIKDKGYIICIDEAVSLIDSYNYVSASDLVSLLNDGKVEINPSDGMVVWIAGKEKTEPYTRPDHKFNKFWKHVINENIYTTRHTMIGDKYKSVFMVSQLTKELIHCAKRVIIITYLFEGSVLDCFLKLKGFKIKRFEDVSIVEASLRDVVSRINLLPYDEKLSTFKLTKGWWDKASKQDVNKVSNYIRRTSEKSGFTSNEVMWTCPSDRVKIDGKTNKPNVVNPKGFNKTGGNYCWLACNIRATNMYSHKRLAIHCFNRYPHVAIDAYLKDYGQKIDADKYALSELLQWVFRSQIRLGDGNVTLAIASKRMYNLYIKWSNGDIKDEFN